MNIAIFGAGYVGCVSAACFAEIGHKVWLVEISPEKLAILRSGESPVDEPGLDTALEKALRTGRVVPTDSVAEAVSATTLGMICVGTPSHPDGSPNLEYVRKVVAEICSAMEEVRSLYCVVLRSTAPYPAIAVEILPHLERRRVTYPGAEIAFALNPEFLREGTAMKDFFEPPFVIVGTAHPGAVESLRRLYAPLSCPFHVVSVETASVLKYACNAYHAVKVVFANEMAALAHACGADPNTVMNLFCEERTLNLSAAYLRPGFAFGGSCLPKDIRALIRLARAQALDCPLLTAVPESNTSLLNQAVEAIVRTWLPASLSDRPQL